MDILSLSQVYSSIGGYFVFLGIGWIFSLYPRYTVVPIKLWNRKTTDRRKMLSRQSWNHWFLMCVCLYQKSVCKEYQTRLQSSATGFLMPGQRHFLSLYSYSLMITQLGIRRSLCTVYACTLYESIECRCFEIINMNRNILHIITIALHAKIYENVA